MSQRRPSFQLHYDSTENTSDPPETMSNAPALPLKSKNSSKFYTGDTLNSGMNIPSLPSKSKSDMMSNKPSTSDSPRSPASFLNPLYFASNPSDTKFESVIQEIKSIKPPEATATAPIKTDNSDTDSIYFLENHEPSLTKLTECRKELNRGKMDHVYEICEVKEVIEPEVKKVADIFDLVSFKSPLYGTLPFHNETNDDSEASQNMSSETYDVPSFLPPSYPPPPPPAILPEANPVIPPRIKAPPVPIRTSASMSIRMSEDEEHIYEAGPRDEPELFIQVRNKLIMKGDVKHTKNSYRMSSVGVQLCGYLCKIHNGKDISQKWFSLEGTHLCCYQDSKASSPTLEIPLKSIVGVTNTHSTYSSHCDSKLSELWCFRILIRDGNHWFLGASCPSERSDWVSQLSLVIAAPCVGVAPSTLTGVQGAGEVLVKEGISGSWERCQFLCHNRILNLLIGDRNSIRKINLQQVSAVAQESNRLSSANAIEQGLVFHLDLPQQVVYLQGDWPIYTESLMEIVQQSWMIPPHAGLADQYLTTDNVPVIVDKCIKFISTHGTTMEGIYRLSGSSSKVRQLLEYFSRDVWSVHLKLDDYNPHDVATVLKRYLRNLPDCLLTEKQYALWVQSSLIENKPERLQATQQLLAHLPDINYQTLKKLMGHLCIISENCSHNLMPAINLAPVFGPTLLYKASLDVGEEPYNASNIATDIVADLISNYSALFNVKPQELEMERQILIAVQKMKESRLLQKPAGDMLIGIYIYNKEWGKCINIKLTPSTTARDICEYAISVGNVREPINKIALMEVICDGELVRPLHYTEGVLPVTMRWLTWGQEEAKGNYLLVKHNEVYDNILPVVSLQNGQALSVFGEISFADCSTKSFKKLNFEFTRANLKIYKMSKNSQSSIGEWNVEEIVWYLGADSKRTTPSKWTFSFLGKKTAFKRTKTQPYFGCTVCCKTQEELNRLVAALLIGEHPKGLLPTIALPDLLS